MAWLNSNNDSQATMIKYFLILLFPFILCQCKDAPPAVTDEMHKTDEELILKVYSLPSHLAIRSFSPHESDDLNPFENHRNAVYFTPCVSANLHLSISKYTDHPNPPFSFACLKEQFESLGLTFSPKGFITDSYHSNQLYVYDRGSVHENLTSLLTTTGDKAKQHNDDIDLVDVSVFRAKEPISEDQIHEDKVELLERGFFYHHKVHNPYPTLIKYTYALSDNKDVEVKHDMSAVSKQLLNIGESDGFHVYSYIKIISAPSCLFSQNLEVTVIPFIRQYSEKDHLEKQMYTKEIQSNAEFYETIISPSYHGLNDHSLFEEGSDIENPIPLSIPLPDDVIQSHSLKPNTSGLDMKPFLKHLGMKIPDNSYVYFEGYTFKIIYKLSHKNKELFNQIMGYEDDYYYVRTVKHHVELRSIDMPSLSTPIEHFNFSKHKVVSRHTLYGSPGSLASLKLQNSVVKEIDLEADIRPFQAPKGISSNLSLKMSESGYFANAFFEIDEGQEAYLPLCGKDGKFYYLYITQRSEFRKIIN